MTKFALFPVRSQLSVCFYKHCQVYLAFIFLHPASRCMLEECTPTATIVSINIMSQHLFFLNSKVKIIIKGKRFLCFTEIVLAHI